MSARLARQPGIRRSASSRTALVWFMCRWPRARPLLLLALAQATHAWHEGHRVSGFEHVLSAPSYAGLLPGGNGSAAAEAELFYWLFLAQNGKPNAPVVVWMNGGPGLSSMFSKFSEAPEVILPGGGAAVPLGRLLDKASRPRDRPAASSTPRRTVRSASVPKPTRRRNRSTRASSGR